MSVVSVSYWEDIARIAAKQRATSSGGPYTVERVGRSAIWLVVRHEPDPLSGSDAASAP